MCICFKQKVNKSYRTLLSNKITISHLWLFKFKYQLIKWSQIKNSVLELYQLHYIVTCSWWLTYLVAYRTFPSLKNLLLCSAITEVSQNYLRSHLQIICWWSPANDLKIPQIPPAQCFTFLFWLYLFLVYAAGFVYFKNYFAILKEVSAQWSCTLTKLNIFRTEVFLFTQIFHYKVF